MASKISPFGLRMPPDIKDWIDSRSKQNRSSQNNEIVRILAKAMAEDSAAIAAQKATTGQAA